MLDYPFKSCIVDPAALLAHAGILKCEKCNAQLTMPGIASIVADEMQTDLIAIARLELKDKPGWRAMLGDVVPSCSQCQRYTLPEYVYPLDINEIENSNDPHYRHASLPYKRSANKPDVSDYEWLVMCTCEKAVTLPDDTYSRKAAYDEMTKQGWRMIRLCHVRCAKHSWKPYYERIEREKEWAARQAAK